MTIKILFADTAKYRIKVLEKDFKAQEYDFFTADTAKKAKNIHKNEKPDITFIDVDLFDKIQSLPEKADEYCKKCKIILTSPYNRDDKSEFNEIEFNLALLKYKEQGISGFLIKPITIEKILEKIHQFFPKN